MSIITFWNGTREQLGNTSSAIAVATQIAMEHNIKLLLMSTSFNDEYIDECFFKKRKEKKIKGLSLNLNDEISQNGIEGLDRLIRSNKVTPEIITNYTEVVIPNRLEVLPGIKGKGVDYDKMKDRYLKIIELANQYYDMVVVDLDRRIGKNTDEILRMSDIIIAMIPQRKKEIERIYQMMNSEETLNKNKTFMVIGKYMEDTKYNAKNISRSILKTKKMVNVIPYNKLFFEASQEGEIIDLFLNLIRIKSKDNNYEFINEIRKIYDEIKNKMQMLQLKII